MFFDWESCLPKESDLRKNKSTNIKSEAYVVGHRDCDYYITHSTTAIPDLRFQGFVNFAGRQRGLGATHTPESFIMLGVAASEVRRNR